MSIDPQKFIFLDEGLLIKTNWTVLLIYYYFLGSKGQKQSEQSSAGSLGVLGGSSLYLFPLFLAFM